MRDALIWPPEALSLSANPRNVIFSYRVHTLRGTEAP